MFVYSFTAIGIHTIRRVLNFTEIYFTKLQVNDIIFMKTTSKLNNH